MEHDLGEAIRQLHQRRHIWETKPALQEVYRHWADMIRPHFPQGPVLEVGAGSGTFQRFFPNIISSDLLPVPWIDVRLDGCNLPCRSASLAGIVTVDLVHHLADPDGFLDQAAKAIAPGGRVILIEPWITPCSRLFYGLLHHERIGPLEPRDESNSIKDPWDGDLALMNVLLDHSARPWHERHPQLQIVHREPFSFFDFQVAGGYKSWSLVGSSRAMRLLTRADRTLAPLMRWLAFRMLLVAEIRAQSD